ncbi:S8 family serine peptidase [Shewanella corallii]|uniref:S8 family serine peptidase n=1 Tax=Shewanella corallii TaxID=560080 RepID=A0ABT0N282_9GAMM|nr:S8 family serine peptidase [Shewanella corallii]
MKSPIATAVSLGLLSAASMAQTITPSSHSTEVIEFRQHSKPASLSNKAKVGERVIVELESTSLASAFGKSLGFDTQATTFTAAHLSHRHKINKEQTAFSKQISSDFPQLKITKKFDTVLNGVVVTGDQVDLKALGSLPGVKAVYPERFYHAQLDASLNTIKAEAMWNAVNGIDNAGKGIKVAIIDGGIRPENPMFSGAGFSAPASRPNDDYCATTDASFCNNKLIVARWYNPSFTVCSDEHLSPLDWGGHGTHVAGTAVGNPVTVTQNGEQLSLSGVAPAAYLMVYKALFADEGCGGGVGTNIMLTQALEDAIEDGADVINNSWGGGAGGSPDNSVYKSIFEAAEAAGVVVVSAAGNDGNNPQTIGCPACIESGIAVANSTTGRIYANRFSIGNQAFTAINSNSSATFNQDISASVIAAVNLDSANEEGCSAWPAGSFTNNIALISRGTCTFEDKAILASNAGAIAMVVYNNQAGAPITMHMPDAPIPGVMISNLDGATTLDLLGNNTQGTISAAVTRTQSDSLADAINASSSRGPNGNPDFLKPDIAAPGTAILSAVSPETASGSFGFNTGTSMASPHVAGAAALMKQLHPDWSAVDIKTALMSTAKSKDIKDDDGSTPATPFAMGAGRLDLETASQALITFDKGSYVEGACVSSCTLTARVFSKSSQSTSWTLSANSEQFAITASPSSLTLPAGGDAEIEIDVDTGQLSNSDWLFGQISLIGQGQTVRLPVVVLPGESDDSSQLSIIETGSGLTSSDDIAMTVSVNNKTFSGAVTLDAYAPAGTQIDSADDVNLSVTAAETTRLDVDTNTGQIRLQGDVTPGGFGITLISGNSFASIYENGASAISCDGGCDDVGIRITTPEFLYHGSPYTELTISDNGLLVVGGGDTSTTANNRRLPGTEQPNNILAPFWTDFDLDGTQNNDSGGGLLATGEVLVDGQNYFVVEWYKARPYNDNAGREYSFSVWINTGSNEEIFFNYIDLASLPLNLTIGAEDISGNEGSSYHFNTDGDTVSSGQRLKVNTQPGSLLSLTFPLSQTNFNPGQADSISLQEDSSVNFNVLDNDGQITRQAKAELTDGMSTLKAQRLITISPTGELGNVELVTSPQHGSLTLQTNGTANYQPDENYFGEDSFSYRVTDESGLPSDTTSVSLTVNNVNDAPQVNNFTTSVNAGSSVELNADVSDADNDTLTYNWAQTSGTQVSVTNSGSSIGFTAPASGTLVFELTVSDGLVTSNTGRYQVNIVSAPTPPSGGGDSGGGGGAVGWLIALLLPLLWRRRLAE